MYSTLQPHLDVWIEEAAYSSLFSDFLALRSPICEGRVSFGPNDGQYGIQGSVPTEELCKPVQIQSDTAYGESLIFDLSSLHSAQHDRRLIGRENLMRST